MRYSRLTIPLLVFTAACAPGIRPLPPMAPLPEPPAESPEPFDARTARPVELLAPELMALRERGLLVPVEGIQPQQISDSFSDARDGQRVHNAVDILAKRGTPVLSADDGVILRVGKNALGGNVVWAADATRTFSYYYAHLEGWAHGLKEGMSVSRGDVIGYVGTTGNAPKNVPHLHFQLLRMTDARHFTDGPPINPLPYFVLMPNATR
jgi:murein DD-endopeptidase MepM/ murein hydrolase activator NlpD